SAGRRAERLRGCGCGALAWDGSPRGGIGDEVIIAIAPANGGPAALSRDPEASEGSAGGRCGVGGGARGAWRERGTASHGPPHERRVCHRPALLPCGARWLAASRSLPLPLACPQSFGSALRSEDSASRLYKTTLRPHRRPRLLHPQPNPVHYPSSKEVRGKLNLP